MSNPITHPKRFAKISGQPAITFRLRLEQLENRTLLSGACDPPCDPGVEQLSFSSNESVPTSWFETWSWPIHSPSTNWSGQHSGWNEFSGDVAPNWFDGGPTDFWQAGDSKDDMRSWSPNQLGGALDSESLLGDGRGEPTTDTFGQLGSQFEGLAGNGWNSHGLIDGEYGSAWKTSNLFNEWSGIENSGEHVPNRVDLGGDKWMVLKLDPGQDIDPAPTRPPHSGTRPPFGPVVVVPSDHASAPTVVTLPTAASNLVAASTRREDARYDAESPAVHHEMAAPEFNDESAATLDDALLDLVARENATAPAIQSPREAGTADQSAPASNASASDTVVAAGEMVVAGALAVAFSPPLSRLLAAQAGLAVDGSACGAIQSLWAWLRRRRTRRTEPPGGHGDDAVGDSNYDSIDEALSDSIDTAASRTNAALAGVAGVAVVASAWQQHGSPRASGHPQSRRQLPTPIDAGPTHIAAR